MLIKPACLLPCNSAHYHHLRYPRVWSLTRAAARQRFPRSAVPEVPKVAPWVTTWVVLSAFESVALVVVFLVEQEAVAAVVLSSWVGTLDRQRHATPMTSLPLTLTLTPWTVFSYAADIEQQAAATAYSSASEQLEEAWCQRKWRHTDHVGSVADDCYSRSSTMTTTMTSEKAKFSR